jgi:alkylation response protein AidB-like acyl-CoA dehydrogenase
MELDFTPEQDELRASVRAVLERECPIALVRGIVERGEDASALWKRMLDLDWPALTIPERCGGIGLGFVDLAVVVEELGRAIAPGPLLPTVSQLVPAVREAAPPEQADPVLAAVASGALTGTLAVAERGAGWRPAAIATEFEPDGAGWVLRGTKRFVVEGASVDQVVVAGRLAGTDGLDGITLALVPSAGLDTERLAAVDESRPVVDIHLDGVRVGADQVLGEPGAGGPPLARALEEATVATAIELVGTCQTIFDIALEYAKVRQQFGAPIGSFQAVKHKLANMFVALERARATCYFAAATVDEDDPRRPIATSMAKAAAGDCQRLVAQDGIQLLGGIGYTWEHDMQLYVKRAKAAEVLFGSAAEHRQVVADLLGIGPS